ncbi:MAG: signal peptide peptidase SppA [Deltaproteobacteria bacterium]|nr:signal peptide peptidase SppA [Deltaproteobacteria bacterium]
MQSRAWPYIKNILAALGAFLVVITALSLALMLTGRGGYPAGDRVAVVEIDGIISDPTDVCRELDGYGENKAVKAVVIRINSPGGAVGPSQEIHGCVMRLKKTKAVVASMGSIAASGGYYAASAANKIVANPGTITGSIGVLVEFVNASELLSKIGLKGYVVKSGKFKDMGSPFRKMDAEETEYLQAVIDDINSQFIKAVAEGRGLKEEDVRAIADGRIFTGEQAKTLGLVDQTGGLSDAIDLSAKLSGIEGRPNVIYPEKKFGILRALFGKSGAAGLTELLSGLRIMYLTPTFSR